MQATSSQVTLSGVSFASVFAPDALSDEPGAFILPVLQRDARAAGRDHLLVGRRRRNKRRDAR